MEISEELWASLLGQCTKCKQDYLTDRCPVRERSAWAGYYGSMCPSCADLGALEHKKHLVKLLNSKPYCETDCPQYKKCLTYGIQ
jgi:hypothetical protein